MVIACWEYICKSLFGMSAINDDKMRAEGKWNKARILLGFEINVDSLTIQLPAEKRSDSWEKAIGPMFTPGNRAITAKKVQELRGLGITGDMLTSSGAK